LKTNASYIKKIIEENQEYSGRCYKIKKHQFYEILWGLIID